MLVLTRKVGQRVFVNLPTGERVEVVVMDVDAGRVRLGFAAPQDIEILREELQKPPAARDEAVPPVPSYHSRGDRR